MSDLKVGTIIKLKSGGPNMTVAWVHKSGSTASCEWFTEGAVKSHDFPITSLELVKKTNEG